MLKRVFPQMTDRPEKGMAIALVFYGFMSFMLMPLMFVYMGADIWNKKDMVVWLDLVYHTLNGAIVGAMFLSHLRESFLTVQLYTKKFLTTVAIATLIMLTIALEVHFHQGIWAGNAYPIHVLPIAMSPGMMVRQLPLWGTLCQTLLSPFAVAGIFYAAGFASWSCKKPWLGYLVVPFVVAIPLALDVNWRGGAEYAILSYLLQLPIHLVACWSYQKADTIWAPITCLAIFNLGTSLLCLLPM